MSFQESAESLKAKTHLSEVKTPVLVGICALALAAAFLTAQNFGSLLGSDAFEIAASESSAGAIEKGDADGGADGGTKASVAVAQTVFVHVSGRVASPGVYELAEGARVQAAIDAAGGFGEDAALDSLNLARILIDGEQIHVPSESEAQISQEGSGAGTGGPSASGKVNINTAGISELDSLPGVGESTAQKIIADREANGPFSSVEELKRVSGIGEKKYAQLADLICI